VSGEGGPKPQRGAWPDELTAAEWSERGDSNVGPSRALRSAIGQECSGLLLKHGTSIE
jgi:hypothetical protein